MPQPTTLPPERVRVIVAYSPADLDRKVRLMAANGWIPQGTAVLSTTGRDPDLVQVMYLPDCISDEPRPREVEVVEARSA